MEGNVTETRLYLSGATRPYAYVLPSLSGEGSIELRTASSGGGDDEIWYSIPEIYVIADRPDQKKDYINNDVFGGSGFSTLGDLLFGLQWPETGGGGGYTGPYEGEEGPVLVRFEISGRGSISVPEEFTVWPFTTITATAYPAREKSGVKLSEFIGWRCNGKATTDETFVHRVNLEQSVNVYVTFHDYYPCREEGGGKADPLMRMEILGTAGSGIEGGTFGKTRVNRTKHHNGLDLKAAIGTPIFSICDGRVTKVRDAFEQGVPFDRYRNLYGDEFDDGEMNAGNVIHVQDMNSDMAYRYLHVAASYVEVGDIVKRGDIIGVVGTTGNASSEGSAGAHLHIEARPDYNNGDAVDPEPYLYSRLDSVTGKSLNPCK